LVKGRPDEIKHVIKAGIKAARYINQNREGTIQVLMEWLKTDKEIPVSDVADLTILRAAQTELGIKGK